MKQEETTWADDALAGTYLEHRLKALEDAIALHSRILADIQDRLDDIAATVDYQDQALDNIESRLNDIA